MTEGVRVLHVIDTFSSDFFETLAVHARPRAQISVCALLTPSETSVARLREVGVTVHVIGARRVASLSTARTLSRLIRSERPDVVHAHMTAPALVALPLARSRGRVLSRHHGSPHHGLQHLHHRITDLLAALLARRVVVASAWLRDVVRAEGVPAKRLVLIPFGLDVGAVEPARLDADRPVVVAAGRLHPEKGLDVLVAAIAELRDRGQVVPSVVIAGHGPARGALEDQIASLGLGARVRLLGFRHDLPSLLVAADVVVVPSRAETFGQVAQEAILSGAPVIASSVDALPELFDGLDTGALVAPGDPAALADAIGAVLGDLEAVRSRAAAACRIAAERWSAPAMAARYVDLYEELVGAR